MAGNITLDNLVSVSELSHGGVSKTLSRVGNNNPIVVMRNNKPAAGVISPDEYRRLTEAEEDFALYLEAEERMKRATGQDSAWTTCSARNTSPSMTAMSRSSNDGLGHRIHRGATRRIKRSWRSRRVSAVGRTGRSDAEDGVNQDHGPSKTARSTIRPTPCGPWPASGTLDQEAEWATSMRVGHQHALRASGPHHANGPMVHMPDQSCGPRESPCEGRHRGPP